ncbi:MAG: hypothetical protein RL508_621 [Actinomycetota bacterium]|jgi:death-on-curing protein
MFNYIPVEVLVLELNYVGFHVKDLGLLDAAVNRPAASAFGEDAYLSLSLKAAAQTQSIIKNHPMVDGNKRSAWIALNLFLGFNGIALNVTQDDIVNFVVAVATDLVSLEEMATWIETHSVAL